MDKTLAMGFSQSLTDLLGNAYSFSWCQLSCSSYESFQVLAIHILHGDKMHVSFFAEVMHAADIPVGDLAAKLQLIPEALDSFFIDADFKMDELKGHDFFYLLVEDFIDPAHPSLAQLFNNLISSGKDGAAGELIY